MSNAGALAPVAGSPDRAAPNPSSDAEFAIGVIALAGKLAKADGAVTADELAAFHDVFRAAPDEAGRVETAFGRAGETTLGFESYARRLARRWASYPAILEDVLDGLFHIACADGVVSADEFAYLRRVAEIFGFSEREFRRIRAAWVRVGADADDPYVILGVDPDISDEDLQRAYRRLAGINHPDRLAARGLSPAIERLATEKMAAINAAYAVIRADRGGNTAIDD